MMPNACELITVALTQLSFKSLARPVPLRLTWFEPTSVVTVIEAEKDPPDAGINLTVIGELVWPAAIGNDTAGLFVTVKAAAPAPAGSPIAVTFRVVLP